MWQTVPASLFGICLFFMNFVLLLEGESLETWQYALIALFSSIYITLIMIAIFEKTIPLRPISEKELEDHEYE